MKKLQLYLSVACNWKRYTRSQV